MDKKRFSIKRLFRSFGYAFNGMVQMFGREQNAKIHAIIALIVIGAGIYFRLSSFEWIIIIIVTGSVFAAEIFNTSIEALSDKVSPQYDEHIKRAKDFAAGGVFIVALVAAIVGLIIFVPKITALF